MKVLKSLKFDLVIAAETLFLVTRVVELDSCLVILLCDFETVSLNFTCSDKHLRHSPQSRKKRNYELGFNILRESDSAFVRTNPATPCSDSAPWQALHHFYWSGSRNVDGLD